MSDNNNLPAIRMDKNQLAEQLDGTRRALRVQDPISGFFHGLEAKAATKALDRETDRTDAFRRNLAAQGGVVREAIALRNAIDDYRARDELAIEHYQLAKARAYSAIDQERAQLSQKTAEARRDALDAKHGLEATRRNKSTNFRLGDVRKAADIAEAESRLPRLPEKKELTPAPAANPLEELRAATHRAIEERDRKLQAGEHDTQDLQDAIANALQALRAAGVEI